MSPAPVRLAPIRISAAPLCGPLRELDSVLHAGSGRAGASCTTATGASQPKRSASRNTPTHLTSGPCSSPHRSPAPEGSRPFPPPPSVCYSSCTMMFSRRAGRFLTDRQAFHRRLIFGGLWGLLILLVIGLGT